jgi:hypothetical protein
MSLRVGVAGAGDMGSTHARLSTPYCDWRAGTMSTRVAVP